MNRAVAVPMMIAFLHSGSLEETAAQLHTSVSESAGNYSSAFWSFSLRNRLPADQQQMGSLNTVGNSVTVFLPTLLVPLSEVVALGAEIPYYVKRVTGDRAFSQRGFGDVSLIAKYTFKLYEQFQLRSKSYLLKARISLLAKLKLPTARHDAVNASGTLLPHDLQLGTGSTDATVGLAFLTETHKYFMIHGHLMYRVNTRASGFKGGNALDYELRYIFARIPIGILYPSLGLRGCFTAENTMGTEKVADSGGHVLFLSPGIQTLWMYLDVAGMFLTVEVSGQVPLVQRLNGAQLGYGYALNAGVRSYFR